jgi:hypothetical protein
MRSLIYYRNQAFFILYDFAKASNAEKSPASAFSAVKNRRGLPFLRGQAPHVKKER